jgi:limonene-1,2-epoxide hydrolase
VSQENVEVVRGAIDAFTRRDIETALDRGNLGAMVDQFYAPDVEFIPLRAATEGAFRGHRGVEEFVADTLENFETFEPHYELRDLGAQVLAWGTIHVRGRGGGVETDIPTGGVFELRQGKIVRWEDFGSREKALEAVGLSE